MNSMIFPEPAHRLDTQKENEAIDISTVFPFTQPCLHLLVSSVSANGNALHEGRKAARIFRQGGWDVSVHVTTSFDDLQQSTQQAPGPLIGAVGGDGYLAEIASALSTRTDNPVLLPLPGGRGNDFCHALGVTQSVQKQAETLVASARKGSFQDHLKHVDGMWIDSNGTRKLSLGVISLGVDALANHFANQSWFKSGLFAYAWGAIKAFSKYHFTEFEMDIDGRAANFAGWVCSISNSGFIGGGINMVPQSDLTDGTLEVLTVEAVSRRRATPILASVLSSRHLDNPLFQVESAQTISLKGPHGYRAMADGDIVARIPFEVNVAPQVLTVCV